MKKCMILFVLLWMIAGCSNVKSDALVVGMELAYPPFETKNNNGDPMGVSVELAKAFGEYLGREVIIENINWTGLIPALQTDKVDLVISSMTITEVRKESVDFSDGYAKAYLAFLVNNNSPVTVAANLNNAERTIAVKTGSTGDFYVTSNYPLAKVLRLDDESAAIAEVINGRADAFIYDQLTIVRNYKQYQDKTKTVFIDNQLPEFWGAAFKKSSPLVAQFNAFLKKFKEENGFEPIVEQYLKEEKKLFDDLGFPFFFD